MTHDEMIRRLIASRKEMPGPRPDLARDEDAAEGGCGVIGLASDAPVAGRHLLQALAQMRNRGNGKGGGIAAAGLVPEELGVSAAVLERDYLLAVAYLDASIRHEVEREYVDETFVVDHVRPVPRSGADQALAGLEVPPPEVVQYFARVKPQAVETFKRRHGLNGTIDPAAPPERIADEIVYQNTYRLNRAYYAAAGEKRAFVLSHGKNLLVLKMVGYGDDVVRAYRLEDFHAHVWIGHHRYPTKGKVWHPGGAHPFVGLHEALVHNGDFANYASMSEYLAQRNIYPLFLTDTEVSAQVFDLLHRVYGYPLEYVIEALAPTTERDFTRLPAARREVYRRIQQVHMHGSPDGPWFFLIAQAAAAERAQRLIGITDTSMLRPQVFALQHGAAAIGLAASEKQAIDAALESLAAADARFWGRADRYWNARGGSHTDGGAFLFTVRHNGAHPSLECTDKYGRAITVERERRARPMARAGVEAERPEPARLPAPASCRQVLAMLAGGNYADVAAYLEALEREAVTDAGRGRTLEVLTWLMDSRYPTGGLRRSRLLAMADHTLARIIDQLRGVQSNEYLHVSAGAPEPGQIDARQTAVIDARGYTPEGDGSLARVLVTLYRRGCRRFLITRAQGHRFIGNGFGPDALGVRIDVYGSSGDYLGSGLDGAELYVHGTAQDQVAQIMKRGKLVIYGDVGQTFLYAAKGGDAYVLGNAAGRPLINAVGRPRVVINGTCLDYLAESFMAGDPVHGGGFAVVNGLALADDGSITELETPYPGGNLFSLASGGAIYLRDPQHKVSGEQLNGGEFVPLEAQDWELIRPYLEENERLFGIPVARLLEVEGTVRAPADVYRKLRPQVTRALQAEEAWVRGSGERAGGGAPRR